MDETLSFYERYIPPYKIIYTVDQCKWLLYWRHELITGVWPIPDPTEQIKSTVSSPHASFETACLAIGELEYRLSLCECDGKITAAYYSDREHQEYYEKNRYYQRLYKLDSKGLDRLLNRCLFYISRRRKPYPYYGFKVLTKNHLTYIAADMILRRLKESASNKQQAA
jgi:hypothetical protein